MLKGIDARMSAELLYCLARMGHGDELLVVDSNYPAVAHAQYCVIKDVIELPGLDAANAIELITTVMPLDYFTDYGAWRMEVDNNPADMTEAHNAVWQVLNSVKTPETKLGSLERQMYYERAKSAFAIVQATENRPFGCFILRKGVVF